MEIKIKIGIIDADLIGKKEHRFPNLACMKLSGFHKAKGDEVELIHFDDINPNTLFVRHFDKVYISKVFIDTKVPENLLSLPFVEYGGTGFFYDKAPNLPYYIEHCMPDYNLYDKWIEGKISNGKKQSYFKYYTDYSIGFTSRGCFRKCEFCVNRNEKKVYQHSPLSEFLDVNRKKICLLDDNILGCGAHWERIIKEIQETKKPFQYKQGMDIRILSDKKAKLLSECKYDGDYIFAFDNVDERELIENKIQVFKKYMPKVVPKLYVFCAFDRNNKYDLDFWINDIIDVLERIKILMKYKCLPYLMRFEKCDKSPLKANYTDLAQWMNAPHMFKKKSINEMSLTRGGKSWYKFKKQYPEIAEKYFDLKFNS